MLLSRKHCETEQMEAGFEEQIYSIAFGSVDIILSINRK